MIPCCQSGTILHLRERLVLVLVLVLVLRLLPVPRLYRFLLLLLLRSTGGRSLGAIHTGDTDCPTNADGFPTGHIDSHSRLAGTGTPAVRRIDTDEALRMDAKPSADLRRRLDDDL